MRQHIEAYIDQSIEEAAQLQAAFNGQAVAQQGAFAGQRYDAPTVIDAGPTIVPYADQPAKTYYLVGDAAVTSTPSALQIGQYVHDFYKQFVPAFAMATLLADRLPYARGHLPAYMFRVTMQGMPFAIGGEDPSLSGTQKVVPSVPSAYTLHDLYTTFCSKNERPEDVFDARIQHGTFTAIAGSLAPKSRWLGMVPGPFSKAFMTQIGLEPIAEAVQDRLSELTVDLPEGIQITEELNDLRKHKQSWL